MSRGRLLCGLLHGSANFASSPRWHDNAIHDKRVSLVTRNHSRMRGPIYDDNLDSMPGGMGEAAGCIAAQIQESGKTTETDLPPLEFAFQILNYHLNRYSVADHPIVPIIPLLASSVHLFATGFVPDSMDCHMELGMCSSSLVVMRTAVW